MASKRPICSHVDKGGNSKFAQVETRYAWLWKQQLSKNIELPLIVLRYVKLRWVTYMPTRISIPLVLRRNEQQTNFAIK